MTTSPPARWAADVGGTLLHSLLALILGIAGFSATISLLALGAGTVIIWIGLPILVAAAYTARGIALAECGLQRALLRSDLPRPQPRRAPADAGWVRRMLTPLADPQTWLDALWTLLSLLLSLLSFPLMILWVLGAAGTIGGPITVLILERALGIGGRESLAWLLGVRDESLALWIDIGAMVVLGLVFLLTVVPLARGLRAAHRGLARGLLSSRWAAQQELLRTRQSRDAGRSAERTALRRLERDLHDGPQQRLVRATMDLARAEQLAQDDPERARATMREIRDQLGGTLDELRRLSRGIAPPVLVDRGMPAALAELAAICPLPTSATCAEEDLPEHVQVGIYYVVSEALANAAKHSGARSVSVDVTRIGHDARVRIEDDGSGGAAVRTGGGLAGLTGRIAALEGELALDSPAGGGTRVEAVIPCES